MADILLKRTGGKSQIKNWIINNLPLHNIYCEPFGGSFAVGLSVNSKKLVYNDLDEHLFNFFKVLREQPEELIRQISFTPYSRKDFEEACVFFNSPERYWLKTSRVEWARQYLIYNRQSFAGKEGGWWAIAKKSENFPYTWKGLPQLAINIADKLKDAYIENCDYKDLFKKWDSEETCWYVDPPYLNVEKEYYKVNSKGFNHEELAQEIHKLQGSIVISYYESDYIKNLYPTFKKITKTVKKHMQTKANKDSAQEMLLIKHSTWATKRSEELYG